MLTTCKAIVTGKRKGERCEFPRSEENMYCGRHQRNHNHEILIKDGKIPCLDFFRGCDAIVIKKGRCDTCKEKKSVKKTSCGKIHCPNKTTGAKYCGKHQKQVYYDEEEEKNIKYCDIDRSCFNLCTSGYSTCESCRNKSYEKEKNRKNNYKQHHNAIELNKEAKKQICVKCGSDYDQYNTSHGKPSMRCLNCNKNQVHQDAMRKDRIRNYKNENFRFMEKYFARYTKSAYLRNHSMNLSFEEFKNLVTMPCHYCHHTIENEVNGIDRINNDLGYEIDNYVPCCEICNKMKHYFHPLFFIEICKIISSEQRPRKDFYKKWKEYYGRSNNHNFSFYKKESGLKRNIKVNMNQEEWDKITRQPCYLCGYQDAKGIGIDRVDNKEREYNQANIKPCCGTCNDIKNDHLLETIKLDPCGI